MGNCCCIIVDRQGDRTKWWWEEGGCILSKWEWCDKNRGKIGTDVGRRNERTACWKMSDSEMYDTDLTGIDNYISCPAAVPV